MPNQYLPAELVQAKPSARDNSGGNSEGQSDLVSVIIPAFNAEQFLASAIGSALAQTHRNLEVIVIDDGSKDNTLDIARGAALRDGRVRVFHQPNQGVAAARNHAIREARGAYIAPLDADDVWHRRKLELQLAALKRVPGAACCYTWQFEIDEENRVGRVTKEGPRWEGRLLPLMILENMVGCASTPLITNAAMLEIGGYDETLRARQAQGCEDWKVSLLLAERYPFAVAPLALTGYRQVVTSMSTEVGKMLRSFDIVMGEIRSRHPDLPAYLFRWSRAKVAAWLSRRAWQAGNLPGAWQMAVEAVRDDPWVSTSFAHQAWLMVLSRASRPFGSMPVGVSIEEFEPLTLPPRPRLRGRVQRRGERLRKRVASALQSNSPAGPRN